MKLRSNWIPTLAVSALAAAALALAPRPGPPGICVAYDNGGSPSLPTAPDGFAADPAYDEDNLAADTFRLLDAESSALCRMETIRRAVIYCGDSRKQSIELLARLSWRALDGQARGDANAPAALFDAGYLAGTLSHLVKLPGEPGLLNDVTGYAWMKRAIESGGHDPEMHFGAAVMTFPMARSRDAALNAEDVYDHHIARAAAGATDNPLLKKNLKAHEQHFGDMLADYRRRHKTD